MSYTLVSTMRDFIIVANCILRIDTLVIDANASQTHCRALLEKGLHKTRATNTHHIFTTTAFKLGAPHIRQCLAKPTALGICLERVEVRRYHA